MGLDEGEDGLVGDAVACLTRGGADEPGFGLVDCVVDVCAEGGGDAFFVGFACGGGGGGGCEGAGEAAEHDCLSCDLC